MPFGVHQIYEEIVAPMVEKLMQENRIERLKIYNQIKDQKISYLNKWHQDTDAFYRSNRAQSADLINLMQETLSQYVAAYNTLISLQKTQDSMNNSKDLESGIVNIEDNSTETLLAFETQAKEFEQVQTDFEEYMDRLKEDIDNRADEFSHIEYYDARLQDGHSNELAIATGEARNMDDRRKALTAVNPLLAKKSELPPTPQIEDIVYEHLSLNLPMIAKNALDELAEKNKKIEQINNSEVFNTNEIDDENLKETEKIKDIEENNTEETYTVLLNNPGENKLALVKVIKENLGLSLAESKDIVDEAPTTITNGLNKDDAEELADSLRSVGADIEVYSSKQEPNE
jgi:ribosomal protein L7/L12